MVRRIRARKATGFLGTVIILWQLFIGAAYECWRVASDRLDYSIFSND